MMPLQVSHVSVVFAIATFALVAHVVAAVCAIRVLRRRPVRARTTPTVSILKPLRGLDDRLEENLESFFGLDYPSYELVFCAADRREPALLVVERLRARYPRVPSSVVVGEAPVGLNPKVRVLSHATRFTRGEVLVVSDSNVRVTSSYLVETVAALEDERVAVVSNLVAGVGERSLGATLENLQLNGFIVPAICLGMALPLASPCVVGKSMVIRRRDLETVGGWAAMGDVLAEDYVLGQRLGALGRRAVISPTLVETVNERWGVGRFLERHDRWLKMRWRINPVALVFELCANVTFWSVGAAVVSGLASEVVVAAGFLVLGRALVEGAVSTVLLPRRRLALWRLALVPIRDLALAVLWFHARCSRSVRWRGGQRLLVGRGSRLAVAGSIEPVPIPAAVHVPGSSAEPS